jgi:hypothetical protein
MTFEGMIKAKRKDCRASDSEEKLNYIKVDGERKKSGKKFSEELIVAGEGKHQVHHLVNIMKPRRTAGGDKGNAFYHCSSSGNLLELLFALFSL